MRFQRHSNKPNGFPMNLIKNFEVKKSPCRNKECKKEVYLTNSLNRFCSVSCKVKVLGVKKVQQTANKVGKTGIKKVSDKRAIQNKEYSKLRLKFLKENPMCEIYPYLKSTEVHHTYSGSNRNRYYLEVSTWMAVSREGHNFIHNNVSISKQKGYLK